MHEMDPPPDWRCHKLLLTATQNLCHQLSGGERHLCHVLSVDIRCMHLNLSVSLIFLYTVMSDSYESGLIHVWFFDYWWKWKIYISDAVSTMYPTINMHIRCPSGDGHINQTVVLRYSCSKAEGATKSISMFTYGIFGLVNFAKLYAKDQQPN